jgi:16S rRNA G527 N7-methylase RsmG
VEPWCLDLISHADEARLVDRHIAESLAGAALIGELGCESIVDLGSGGGFPAIPLAIAGIGQRWTLVESRRNKTLFLRRVVERMELRDIVVVTGRLEVLVESADVEALQCDGFTSRATMRAGPTLAIAARIVRPAAMRSCGRAAGSRPSWQRIGRLGARLGPTAHRADRRRAEHDLGIQKALIA